MKLKALLPLIMSLLSAASAGAAESGAAKTESVVLGGGCFWCTEGCYQIVPGVREGDQRLCRRHGGESDL